MKVRIAALAAWLALGALLILGFAHSAAVRRDRHIAAELVRLASRVEATASNLNELARYTFFGILDDNVAARLVGASRGLDTEQWEPLRSDLRAYMEPQYERMRSFNFRQVHFHTADSISFLRMHSPVVFGDDLSSVRHTVRIANQTRSPVSAFEEGRIFNGYRFVFPLENDGEHVGTVEISYAMTPFLAALSAVTDAQFVFVMSREVVERTVFDFAQSNYIPSTIAPDLLIDRNIPASLDIRLMLSRNRALFVDTLAAGEDFGFFVAGDGRTALRGSGGGNDDGQSVRAGGAPGDGQLVLFHAVRNIMGEQVAWIIGVAPDSSEIERQSTLRSTIVIILASTALLMVLTWITLAARSRLVSLAREDQLTRLMNRHSFLEAMQREIERYKRYDAPLGLVIWDIDHFKQFNDRYGHAEGDAVLRLVARTAESMVRATDFVARWGGEEFVILLPATDRAGTRVVAEKIREAFQAPEHMGRDDISASFGVTTFVSGDTAETFVDRADQALYAAKNGGRNRVEEA
jgi:diguanylate cyclase (GGDEF)-like protein